MRMKLFALIGLMALVMAPTALAAEATCCDKAGVTCCTDHACGMPCCTEHNVPADINALDMLIAIDKNAVFALTDADAPPVQAAVVWFDRATWIGDRVLLGKYVIEHNTDRMARGEPCTHIYAAGDRNRLPVVAFHCTHLEGERADRATVVVRSQPDGTRKLLSLQFAGDSAGHGVPALR